MKTTEIKSLEELEKFEGYPGAVILYGATWCNPCKQFKPHFERAAEEFDIPFGIVYLDTLEGTSQEEQFSERGIQSVPTVRHTYNYAQTDLKERRVMGLISELREIYPRILRPVE